MWIAVPAYFTLACLAVAWMLLPPFRVWAGACITRRWRQFHAAQRDTQRHVRQRTHRRLAHAHGHVAAAWQRLHARRFVWGLGLLLLVAPPMLVYSLRAFHALDAYDDTAAPSSAGPVVAALLQGEQLVPPPSLPPEVFTTAEVQRELPRVAFANRQWELLDVDFRQRLLVVYRVMKEEHGYDMALLEGYRSPERQDELARLGSHVTAAVGGHSQHQHGMAADSAFLRNGRLVISERDPWAMKGYELYGEAARRVGLVWGGHWKNNDYGHVELQRSAIVRPRMGG